MTIEDAIASRRVIRFFYDGLPRVVQPAAIGHHISTGNLLLRGYQIDGLSKSRPVPLWDLFAVRKIAALQETPEIFVGDPPGYTRNDAHLGSIIAQL